MKLVRPHQILCFLRNPAVLRGQKFRTHRCVQHIKKHIRQLLFPACIRIVADQMADQGLGNRPIDTIHGHVIAGRFIGKEALAAEGTAHGHQDFTLAFANSCNGAFASLGLEMDLGKWNSTAGELLFNGPLPLSGIPYKQSAYNMKPGAGTWEILQTSIGQGTTQITPLHNAMITAAIANGGTLMRPYFLDSVVSAGDETIKKFMPAAYGSLMSAEEAAGLTELMRAVVTEGTGSAVRTDAYTVAAKTGSAEFETGKETHAWFTGFAPAESPRLVVTVLVEEGGMFPGDTGSILFDGIDIRDIPPGQRKLGLVYQDYGLFPHMKVKEIFPMD